MLRAAMEDLIGKLHAGLDLETAEVRVAADRLLDDAAPVEAKVRFLEALAAKGESVAEIAEFVRVFLEHAVDPEWEKLGPGGPTIDVCGTGGDKLHLFNVSTTAMFVVAAAGARVVKHGNRGITSKSGGADVLEALGIRIDLPPDGFRDCVAEAGVGFLFAPNYHPAFKAVIPARKELADRGVRTIFNLIGPLLNPAGPSCQLVGVFASGWCPIFADILARLGRESAWVVHGLTGDGRAVDELSLMGPTRICRAGRGAASVDEQIAPADFGLTTAAVSDLTGGDAIANGRILEAILAGEEVGPKRDMVLLNAGAAIACCGLADDLHAGIQRARHALDEGAALERLRRLQAVAV